MEFLSHMLLHTHASMHTQPDSTLLEHLCSICIAAISQEETTLRINWSYDAHHRRTQTHKEHILYYYDAIHSLAAVLFLQGVLHFDLAAIDGRLHLRDICTCVKVYMDGKLVGGWMNTHRKRMCNVYSGRVYVCSSE